MKQLVNELYHYEFTGEIKIEKSEDEEEILTMVAIMIKIEWMKKLKEKWKMFLNH